MGQSSLHLLHTIRDISQDKGGVPITVVQLLKRLVENHSEVTIQLAASPGKSPLLDSSQVYSHLIPFSKSTPLSKEIPPNPPLKGGNSWRDLNVAPIVQNKITWSSIPEGDNDAFQDLIKATAKKQSPLLIHDHGIWLPCNHAVAVTCRRLQLPRIVSPHGMLEPWAWQYKAWKKRLAWFLFQNRDLKTAQVLHATAKSEAINLKKFFPHIPIAMIPLGIDLPPASVLNSALPATKETRTVLFLSRIHEKKGLLNLIEAWSRLQVQNWKLVIAGPDEGGYRSIVEEKIKALNLTSSISLLGEVVGEAKWQLYRNADLFVLPTLSENFGIVIAEALACETPVITTKGAPWSELETDRCGWWIDIGVTPLVETLQKAMSLNDGERTEMGQRGRNLIESNYTWKQTTEQMLEVYRWVLLGGKQPHCLVK